MVPWIEAEHVEVQQPDWPLAGCFPIVVTLYWLCATFVRRTGRWRMKFGLWDDRLARVGRLAGLLWLFLLFQIILLIKVSSFSTLFWGYWLILLQTCGICTLIKPGIVCIFFFFFLRQRLPLLNRFSNNGLPFDGAIHLLVLGWRADVSALSSSRVGFVFSFLFSLDSAYHFSTDSVTMVCLSTAPFAFWSWVGRVEVSHSHQVEFGLYFSFSFSLDSAYHFLPDSVIMVHLSTAWFNSRSAVGLGEWRFLRRQVCDCGSGAPCSCIWVDPEPLLRGGE